MEILTRFPSHWQEWSQRPGVFKGTEHVVKFNPEQKRVIKITVPPAFGVTPILRKFPVFDPLADEPPAPRKAIEFDLATPLEYLQRWLDANDVFGDDVRLNSVVE